MKTVSNIQISLFLLILSCSTNNGIQMKISLTETEKQNIHDVIENIAANGAYAGDMFVGRFILTGDVNNKLQTIQDYLQQAGQEYSKLEITETGSLRIIILTKLEYNKVVAIIELLYYIAQKTQLTFAGWSFSTS